MHHVQEVSHRPGKAPVDIRGVESELFEGERRKKYEEEEEEEENQEVNECVGRGGSEYIDVN